MEEKEQNNPDRTERNPHQARRRNGEMGEIHEQDEKKRKRQHVVQQPIEVHLMKSEREQHERTPGCLRIRRSRSQMAYRNNDEENVDCDHEPGGGQHVCKSGQTGQEKRRHTIRGEGACNLEMFGPVEGRIGVGPGDVRNKKPERKVLHRDKSVGPGRIKRGKRQHDDRQPP